MMGQRDQLPRTGPRQPPATGAARPARAGIPSWGAVLATTVRLWGARRLQRLGRPRRAWLAAAACVLVAGALAVTAVVQLTATPSRPASRAQAAGRPARSPSPRARSARSPAPAAAAAILAQAAAWTASQVAGNEIIACDPSLCAVLSAHGVAPGRLRPLAPSAPGAPGAGIIVASPSAHAWLSAEAPTLLASVGSGAQLIQVRAVTAGGAAAYQAALRTDLADRRSAGAQLLRSGRIEASGPGAGQLAAGEVDSRLLVLLAVLASERSWQVIAFGAAGPGVPLTQAPYRQVVIAAAAGGDGTAALTTALAVLRAQHGLYQPAQVTTVRLAGGRAGLRIGFAAPGPLGLLAGSTPG